MGTERKTKASMEIPLRSNKRLRGFDIRNQLKRKQHNLVDLDISRPPAPDGEESSEYESIRNHRLSPEGLHVLKVMGEREKMMDEAIFSAFQTGNSNPILHAMQRNCDVHFRRVDSTSALHAAAWCGDVSLVGD